MKLTASPEFNALARGASKILVFRSFVRKTASLSEPLDSGTAWTEVTDRIVRDSLADSLAKVEYQLGQFTADSITFSIKDIQWWKDNVFDGTDRVEFKTEMTLQGASDVIYYFSGWVDPPGSLSTELDDQTALTCFSADELGNRLPAELVSCQPIFHNVDGSHDGLILPTLAGIYIIDVNIASYAVTLGTHAIGWDPAQGVNFDGGAWVPIPSNGTYTIGNAPAGGTDTQRAKVYVASPASFPNAVYDDFVVVTSGQTLPKRWYADADIRFILAKLYEQIGMTSVNFDTIEFATWDGLKRLSHIDVPPNNDGVVTGVKNALETDGTNLWVAVDAKLYFRDVLTGVYTLKTTIPSAVITRLFYNARNNQVWIYNGTSIYRYDVGSNTLSSAVSTGNSVHLSMELVDFNYAGTSWEYALVFTDDDGSTSRGKFQRIDGSSLVVTTVATGIGLSYTTGNGIRSIFMHPIGASKIRFRVYNNSGQDALREFQINGSGAWVDNGEKVPGIDNYFRAAAHNDAEGRVYYWFDPSGTAPGIWSHTDSSATAIQVLDLSPDGLCDNIYADPVDDLTYFTVDAASMFGLALYSVLNNTPTLLTSTNAITGSHIYTKYHQMVEANGRLYLINDAAIYQTGVRDLLQWCAKVVPALTMANFKDISVTPAIKKILNSFLLLGTISFAKRAICYRRADDSGNPTTTGDGLALDRSNVSDVQETLLAYPKADLIQINSATKITTYNGTDFDVAVLSDKRTQTISNDFIPDAIARDVAFYAWQFFKVDRSLYRLRMGNVPLFQYEPIDRADVALVGTKISGSGSGPIYTMGCSPDGSATVEALLKLEPITPPPWDPLDGSIGGLIFWGASRKMTGLSDGDAISSWTDFSGLGNHAVQATGANQPIYKTNIINGHPVLRFDGTKWITTPAQPGDSGYTIYIVFNRTSDASASSGYGLVGRDVYISWQLYPSDAGLGLANHVEIEGGNGTTYQDGHDFNDAEWTPGVWHVASYARPNPGGAGELRLDGASAGTYGPGSFKGFHGLTIGAHNAAGSLPFIGDVEEVLIYDGAHTADQVAIVSAYLRGVDAL